MKNNIKFFVGLMLSLTSSFAHGQPIDPSHYPKELLFLGKPIDPLCFFNLEDETSKINLKQCGLFVEKYRISGKNDYLMKQGYYGFNWQDVSDKDQTLNGYGGSSYYKAWDAGNHQYWLLTMNNGGGTGNFASINLYSRKNFDTATLKTIDGGDRCNGGINYAEKANHSLLYSVNLTGYDFLALAKINPRHLQAYNDLSSCAICCVGEAYYEVDKRLKPKFLYVKLDSKKWDELPEQGKYNDCFNKLFISYVSSGKNKLDTEQLKQFVEKFNSSCVK